MGLLARIKSPDWVDGDILTASDLVAEFNNIINGLNGSSDINVASANCSGTLAVIGTSTFTGATTSNVATITTANITTGNITTANTVTTTANVVTANNITSNGFASLLIPGLITNLGLTLANGVLTFTTAAGAALNTTVRGSVCMIGANTNAAMSGTHVVIPFTSGVTIQDDSNATSHFTATEFGISNAVNWSSDVPFFLYVVNRSNAAVDGTDNNSAVCITRNPCMSVMPAAVNIGDKGAAPSVDDQTSVIMFGTYTEANYVGLPTQLIGAVRMQYLTSTKDWTFQTLGSSDGLGRNQLDKIFATTWTMPQAQMGANATSFMLLNGGTTVPQFTNQTYFYKLNRDGSLWVSVSLDGDAGDNGVGAVTVKMVIPYTLNTNHGQPLIVGNGRAVGTGVGENGQNVTATDAATYLELRTMPGASGTSLDLEDFGNGARVLIYTAKVPVFDAS